MVRLPAPGPLMVRLLKMAGSELVRVMVPVTEKLMVPPLVALAIAWRKEPALRLSAVVVTVALKFPAAVKE